MGIFRNEVENTKDYLGDDPMFTNLMVYISISMSMK